MTWLDQLVWRRNQIVHEGNLQRGSKRRMLRLNDIDQACSHEAVDGVEPFPPPAHETVVFNDKE